MRVNLNDKSELADIIIGCAQDSKSVRRACMHIIYRTMLNSTSKQLIITIAALELVCIDDAIEILFKTYCEKSFYESLELNLLD